MGFHFFKLILLGPLRPIYEDHTPIARSTDSIEIQWKASQPQGRDEHYLLTWSTNQVDW